GRRLDPRHELAGPVQPVLQQRELAASVAERADVRGDPFQPGQRRRQALPEPGERGCVALPFGRPGAVPHRPRSYKGSRQIDFRAMATVVVRTPNEFEARLQEYIFERSEEARAVRVGEKETSEQAAIVARYGDLFSRDQLGALQEAEASAGEPDERERIYRLRK